jgi:hypothetical protein
VQDNIAGILKTDALIRKHWPIKKSWKPAADVAV